MSETMRTKTEELLYFLLWNAETLARPTFRNLSGSFESWAYRQGLMRQLDRLAQAKFIERHDESKTSRLYRLTAAGRVRALGGRDPDAYWARVWDGRWRLVLFDVPGGRSSAREKLRLFLRSRGFGYLQNSVWVTPHPLTDERKILSDGTIDVESLLLLEARPCGGESDAEIIAGAWDFAVINHRYEKYLEVLGQRPAGRLDSESAAKLFHRWAGRERHAWRHAVERDPLLPEKLLPADYLGRRAWKARLETLAKAAEQSRTFRIVT